MPRSESVYARAQRVAGALDGDAFKRVPHHVTLLRGLVQSGFDPSGARCLEVGTGHVPVLPVCFYLAGASEVATVDLNRRLHPTLVGEMLEQLSLSRDELVRLYDGLIPPDALSDRLDRLTHHRDPMEALSSAGIRYLAPCDASSTSEPDGSIDLHFSMTVLEHIPPPVIRSILSEARRLLRPNGIAVHRVDTKDHYASTDTAITTINFLRFTDSQWNRLAGNRFAYCNRLRASEVRELFADAGLLESAVEIDVDKAALEALRDGFPLAPQFARFEPEDLATATVTVYAR